MTTTIDRNRSNKHQGSEFRAIKRGDGTVTGYVEVFPHRHNGETTWVTIPGASRYLDAAGIEIED